MERRYLGWFLTYDQMKVESLPELVLSTIDIIKNIEIDKYKDQMEDYFNPEIERFISLTGDKFNCKIYKLITVTENDIYFDFINDERRLFITKSIFYQADFLKNIVIYDLLRQMISSKLSVSEKNRSGDNLASDIAFAVLWDSSSDKLMKNNIYNLWRKIHPPVKILSQNFYLAGYLPIITSIIKNYSYQLIKLFNTRVEIRIRFPYSLYSPSFDDIKKNELILLNIIIKNNTLITKDLMRFSDYSRPTISKIVTKLSSLFIIRERIAFSPIKLGLISIIAIIQVPRGDGEIVRKIKYPMIKLITYFRGSEDIIYINLYIPDTHYAKDQYINWLQESIVGDDGLRITITNPPIIGIELEHMRINFQNPQLFNLEKGNWEIGESYSGMEPDIKNIDFRYSWNQLKRKIALILCENVYTKEELYNIVGGNRNTTNRIYEELFENEIIKREYVIPFFKELTRVLVIYDGNKYNKFIKNVASILPISVNFVINNSSKPDFETNLVGISFLNIPEYYLMHVFNALNRIDNRSKFCLFPTGIENALKLSADMKEEGWNYTRLPKLNFVKSS